MSARGPMPPKGPPAEVVDGAAPAPLGAVSRAILAATLVAFLFGSKALLEWANNLPINPLSDTILAMAQWWQDRSAEIGLTHIAEWVRAILRALESLR
jgi:hypothetical protein